MEFLSDAWLQDFIKTHTLLIAALSFIGSLFGGGGIIGGILKFFAILSPTTTDNKVKTMLENLRKDTKAVEPKDNIYIKNMDGTYTSPNGNVITAPWEEWFKK